MENKLREMKAKEGHVLYHAVTGDFFEHIYLAKDAKETDFEEITEAERDEIIAQREAEKETSETNLYDN